MRKHIPAWPAIIFVRIKDVHLALCAPLIVPAPDTVRYHIAAFITGMVSRLEPRIIIAFGANRRRIALSAVGKGSRASNAG